jgi:hypothetical protein
MQAHATGQDSGLRATNPHPMTDVTASRTLVKSPPELWTECSRADSLARHLDSFGEIRITRLEPESTVAWEGELASGTVRLEPSGWGTRVVLTATPTPPPVAVEAPEATEPVADTPGERVAEAAEPVPEATETVPEATDTAVEPAAETAADPPVAPRGRERGLGAWLRRVFGRRRASDDAGPEVPESDSVGEPPAAVAAPPPTLEPPVPEPEPAAPEPEPAAAEPELAAAEPEPAAAEPEPVAPPVIDAEAALGAALDSLGRAHHRPFSRV